MKKRGLSTRYDDKGLGVLSLRGGAAGPGPKTSGRIANDEPVIHCDEPEGVGRPVRVAVPAEEQHRDVVVPVEEDKRLLSQHDKDCVEQLKRLRQNKRDCPESRRSHAVAPGRPTCTWWRPGRESAGLR